MGLALHMTAIWGNCVFWLKRVVYDRWQGRKSRAAGSSTDMQIAFSWLLYSLRYLSSGLQHACLFTARKQLINSTKGRRKERCFCWFHSVAWKLKPEVVSGGQKISVQVHCVWPHQSRHRGEAPPSIAEINLGWNWIWIWMTGWGHFNDHCSLRLITFCSLIIFFIWHANIVDII